MLAFLLQRMCKVFFYYFYVHRLPSLVPLVNRFHALHGRGPACRSSFPARMLIRSSRRGRNQTARGDPARRRLEADLRHIQARR